MVDNQASTVATFDQAKIVQKLKLRIIPFVFVLYIISFLDRTNISFAALTMNQELAITSKQFGWVAGIFFFGNSTTPTSETSPVSHLRRESIFPRMTPLPAKCRAWI